MTRGKYLVKRLYKTASYDPNFSYFQDAQMPIFVCLNGVCGDGLEELQAWFLSVTSPWTAVGHDIEHVFRCT